MKQVNILEAKTNFSRLIKMLESKEEEEIIVARDNKPVAKIVLFNNDNTKRIGLTKGKYPPLDLDLFNSLDEEIGKEFLGW